MSVLRPIAFTLPLLCAALFCNPAATRAAAEVVEVARSAAPPLGVVYVESNIGRQGGNSILAWTRDANGVLRELPGSPFPTRGTGILDRSLALGPFDSDQNLITNPERTLLFAVNSGSNTIAVFHIRPDGGLEHVAGSPFPSGGINPVSVGLSRDTLVVVNKAMDPRQPTGELPNYVSFRVTAAGRLGPIPLSEVQADAGSSPSQALISPSQHLAFGADFLGGSLQSFVIQPNGTLYQNKPQALPDSVFAGSGAPPNPLGLAAHPSRPIVYVGFVTVNQIGVYTYDVRGRLSFVRAIADSGVAVCWLRLNATGTRLYASNTGDNSITVYDTTSPLHPRELQRLKLTNVGSVFQIELDPRGGFVYAVTQRATPTVPQGKGNTLHVLRVKANGTLAENRPALELELPVGTRPQGLATLALD